MATGIPAHAEAELRKRLDLSKARITQAGRPLVALCQGKSSTRAVERALTLHCSGRRELSGYPPFGASARIVANRRPAPDCGGLPIRDLRKIAAVPRQAAA